MTPGATTVARAFAARHPAEAARALEHFSVEQVTQFVASLPPAVGADVVRQMPPHRAALCLGFLNAQGAAAVVERMPARSGAFILRRLSQDSRNEILAVLSKELRQPIGRLLNYPENTAGSVVDPLVFTLYGDMTAEESMLQARRQAKHLSHFVPVVNRDHQFIGVVTMRNLMMAPPREIIEKLLKRDFGFTGPSARLERVVLHPQWDACGELAVVDTNRVFLGMLQKETLADLHGELVGPPREEPGHSAPRALGELFWIGMSAVVAGAASMVRQEREVKS